MTTPELIKLIHQYGDANRELGNIEEVAERELPAFAMGISGGDFVRRGLKTEEQRLLFDRWNNVTEHECALSTQIWNELNGKHT